MKKKLILLRLNIAIWLIMISEFNILSEKCFRLYVIDEYRYTRYTLIKFIVVYVIYIVHISQLTDTQKTNICFRITVVFEQSYHRIPRQTPARLTKRKNWSWYTTVRRMSLIEVNANRQHRAYYHESRHTQINVCCSSAAAASHLYSLIKVFQSVIIVEKCRMYADCWKT